MLLKGLDISSETQEIDYNSIKNSIDFVMIRAGLTDYDKNKTKKIDPSFKRNYELAKKYKIDIGVYYCSRAVNKMEAKQEVDYFLNIIKDMVFEYPIVFQIEDDHNTTIYYPENQKNLKKEELLNIINYMINEVKTNGYDVMIRTYDKWYINIFNLEHICLYWVDDPIDLNKHMYSYLDSNIIYLNNEYKDNSKIELVVKENCILDKIKKYIKAGYKILMSKIRKS